MYAPLCIICTMNDYFSLMFPNSLTASTGNTLILELIKELVHQIRRKLHVGAKNARLSPDDR